MAAVGKLGIVTGLLTVLATSRQETAAMFWEA